MKDHDQRWEVRRDRARARSRLMAGIVMRYPHSKRHRFTSRLVIGSVMLVLGVLWTLDNLGIADAGQILRWWPMGLLAYGIAKIGGWGFRRSTFGGWVCVLLGGWMQLRELGYVHGGWGALWPLILIAIGTRIVMHSIRAGAPPPDPATATDDSGDGDRVMVMGVMSGTQRRTRTKPFHTGEVLAVLSNTELDLRECPAPEGRVTLDVTAVLGGVRLFVPTSWVVESDIVCVMGAVEDLTPPHGEPAAGVPLLVLRGAAVMGGIEIRN